MRHSSCCSVSATITRRGLTVAEEDHLILLPPLRPTDSNAMLASTFPIEYKATDETVEDEMRRQTQLPSSRISNSCTNPSSTTRTKRVCESESQTTCAPCGIIPKNSAQGTAIFMRSYVVPAVNFVLPSPSI